MPQYERDLLRAQYPTRDTLFPGEEQFFRSRPDVAGYAAPDQQVVLNPYSPLPDADRRAVALNEAARLRMMDRGNIFQFPITDNQNSFFANSEYSRSPQMARHSIVARIIAGDPSAGPYTSDQEAAAQSVLAGLLFE